MREITKYFIIHVTENSVLNNRRHVITYEVLLRSSLNNLRHAVKTLKTKTQFIIIHGKQKETFLYKFPKITKCQCHVKATINIF